MDFVVLDMKEDKNILIILGSPFLSTARSLIYIHDSKITLRIEDEEITFEMNQEMSHEKPLDEVLRVNNLEGKKIQENLNKLNEIEKLMEEELKVWEKPKVEEFKLTKPIASIPITFEVFAFTTPKAQLDEAI